jgi:hypothetical protein
MAHFVQNVHNYILVEVLESAWTEFTQKAEKVHDLDELIEIQKQFVADILDRALLSDTQRDLYRLVQKLLNQVYMFVVVKEKYLVRQALQECQRLDNIQLAKQLGNPPAEEDMESHIAPNTLDQLNNISGEFFH